MPKLIALGDTKAKSDLLGGDRITIKRGTEVWASSAKMLPDGHALVDMTWQGRSQWYLYAKHWDGLPMAGGERSPEGSISPKDFRLNAIARNAILAAEGMKLVAYQCPMDVWTIGIGSTRDLVGNPVRQGMQITESEAWAMLEKDCQQFLDAIARSVKVPLTGKQIAALTDFTYNVGASAFEESTLVTLINARATVEEIQFQFNRWNRDKLDGLRKRRLAEGYLWAGKEFSLDWYGNDA